MTVSLTSVLSRRAFVALTAFSFGAVMALPAVAKSKIATDKATGAAIRGYDTTSYFVKSAATKGVADHSVEWKGVTWRFATKADADLFQSSPEAFAPQFGGFCTRAASFGKLVPADPEVWRIHDQKLYMFAKPIGGKKFDEGAEAMIKKAASFWASLP